MTMQSPIFTNLVISLCSEHKSNIGHFSVDGRTQNQTPISGSTIPLSLQLTSLCHSTLANSMLAQPTHPCLTPFPITQTFPSNPNADMVLFTPPSCDRLECNHMCIHPAYNTATHPQKAIRSRLAVRSTSQHLSPSATLRIPAAQSPRGSTAVI